MELDVGSCVGHYRLLELLGEGGMGRVFKGRHEPTGKFVAIKVLYGSMARGEIRARFVKEAQILRRLSQGCTGIVSYIDHGEAEGNLFLVMELLIGESLDARLARHRLSPYKAVEIIRDVAQIVAYAHEQSVTHRDLKPANIFLTSDDKVKVLDFGIAKLRDDTQATTRTGVFFGTPEFCSLAQIESTKDAGPRDDAWSLAAILYELVTGVRAYPFNGTEIGKAISSRKFLPERRGLDDSLWAMISKGLCLNQQGQYPSAEPLARDLDQYLRMLAGSQKVPATRASTSPAAPAASDTFKAGGTVAAQGGVLPPAGLTSRWDKTVQVEVKTDSAQGAPSSSPPRASQPPKSWSLIRSWLAVVLVVALFAVFYFGAIIALTGSTTPHEPIVAIVATDAGEGDAGETTDSAVDEDGGREPSRRGRHARRGTRNRRPEPTDPPEEPPNEVTPPPAASVDPVGYPIRPSTSPFGNVGGPPPAPTSQALQNAWLRRNWDSLSEERRRYWCNTLHTRDRIFPGSAPTDLPEGCRQHLPLRPHVIRLPSYWH
ncbi:serine/threonine protein kinase [Patescibacteria group bacterium]|nr:serine/threonine protein kinase [Patescibacteria group bacterium]